MKILKSNDKNDSFAIIKIANCYIKLFKYKKAIDLLVKNEILIDEEFRLEYFLYLAKTSRKMKSANAAKFSIQEAALCRIDSKHEDIVQDLKTEKSLIQNLIKDKKGKFEILKNLKFSTKQQTAKSTYKILSIDGGGTRGIIPSYWLMELERIVKKPVCQMFDLLAGVSTGALISGCLSIPDQSLLPKYKAFDIYNLYLNKSKELFESKNTVGYLLGKYPKYNNDGKAKIINKYIGDLMLDRCLTDLVIPTVRIDNYQTTPFCFNRFDAKHQKSKNIKLSDALMATSAAPTYFPSYKIDDFGVFVDVIIQLNSH